MKFLRRVQDSKIELVPKAQHIRAHTSSLGPKRLLNNIPSLLWDQDGVYHHVSATALIHIAHSVCELEGTVTCFAKHLRNLPVLPSSGGGISPSPFLQQLKVNSMHRHIARINNGPPHLHLLTMNKQSLDKIHNLDSLASLYIPDAFVLVATAAARLTSLTSANAAIVSANAHFLPGPAHPIISKLSCCVAYTVPPPTEPTSSEGKNMEKLKSCAIAPSYSIVKWAQELSTTLAASCPVKTHRQL